MLIRCVDLEFTGEPTEDDPHAVCEVGFCDIEIGDDGSVTIDEGGMWQSVTKPHRPMPSDSRAVHHISDEEIVNGIETTTAFMRLMGNELEHPRPDYFCAHNVTAEQGFFKGGGIPWLCTYRIGLRLWPDLPAHKLQFLRYELGLPLNQQLGLPAHRAGPDAYVGAHLMARIWRDKPADMDLAKMVRFSKGHPLMTRISFGKHKGQKFADLPMDYLEWIIMKSDMGPEVKANAKHWQKVALEAKR